MTRTHLRRVDISIGLVSLAGFLVTGQFMRWHTPPMPSLPPDWRMMYLSRHIYLLGAALVNVALGLYREPRPEASRRALQGMGSLLIAASPALLPMAFGGAGTRNHRPHPEKPHGIVRTICRHDASPRRRGQNAE